MTMEGCVRKLEGHSECVHSVAISSADGGGRWALSASYDTTLRLWDLQSGECVRTLEGHEDWIRTAAIASSDGGCRWAVSASRDRTLRLWDLQAGTCVRVLEDLTADSLFYVAISAADGGCRWAVAAAGKTLLLCDLQAGACVRTIEGHTSYVNAVELSEADGGRRWAVSASADKTLRLWDLQSWDLQRGACVRTLEGHSGFVYAVAISHADGGCHWAVSASADTTLRLWDLQSGATVCTLEGHTSPVLSVALCDADGGCRWAVSASYDGSVRLWDVQGAACVHAFEGHTGCVYSVAVAASDGCLRAALSASFDGTVCVWDLAQGQGQGQGQAQGPEHGALAHAPAAGGAGGADGADGAGAGAGGGLVDTLDGMRRAAEEARAALQGCQDRIRASLGAGGGVDEALVAARDACRARLAAALERLGADALSERKHGAAAMRQEARVLRAALAEELAAGGGGGGGGAAAPSGAAALARACVAALRAHDAWLDAGRTDGAARGAVACAWALARAWAEHLEPPAAPAAPRPPAESDDAAGARAWARALRALEARVGAGRLLDAAAERAAECERSAALAEGARELARAAEAELRAVRALPSADVARGAELREREDEARRTTRALRAERRRLEDAEEEAASGEGGAAEVERARRAVLDAQRAAQAAQRGREQAVDRLYEWAGGPFPELPAVLPELFSGAGALPAGARPALLHGRALEQYGRVEWPAGAAPGVARHPILLCEYAAERVVLKEYPLGSDTERRRLEREVAVARAHAHPNVARACGVFLQPSAQGGGHARAYVQAPLYSGGTLRGWLEREPPPPADATRGASPAALYDPRHPAVAPVRVRALRQLLSAVAHLHARQVVHGDLKLENALVQLPGDDASGEPLARGEAFRVRLADFDLARADGDDDGGGGGGAAASATTRAGGGTDGHMAPELLAGGRASAATDVFAFGVCVLRALAADEPTRAAVLGSLAGARRAAAALGEPLIVAALSDSARARPSAARLEGAALFGASDEALREAEAARAAAAAARAACVVCLDDVPPAHGVDCAGDAPPADAPAHHFVCDECLSAHVLSCAEPDVGGGGGRRLDEDGCVRCVGGGCERTYLDSTLARHATRAAFDAYWRARERRTEAKAEAGVELRVREELARRTPAGQGGAAARRRHIVEEILTLKCPRCSMAFAEWLDGERGFNGCCALKCARERCGCRFCAYCLADCGDDAAAAHAHVRECAQGNGSWWASNAEFAAAQHRRRVRELRAYLDAEAGEDGAARSATLRSVERELRDLQIELVEGADGALELKAATQVPVDGVRAQSKLMARFFGAQNVVQGRAPRPWD